MKQITLYLGNSDIDETLRRLIEEWHTKNPDVSLSYKSIHQNPADAVRFGITDLPALVINDAVIAQGKPENWILPLLENMITQDQRGS